MLQLRRPRSDPGLFFLPKQSIYNPRRLERLILAVFHGAAAAVRSNSITIVKSVAHYPFSILELVEDSSTHRIGSHKITEPG